MPTLSCAPSGAPVAARRRAAVAHTPMAFAQAIVLAYERRGLSPAQALAAAHLAPQTVSDAQATLTAVQFERLSFHAMRELDDEALGWFARRLPWGSYGMLARASISAPTLGLAAHRWCRHHGLLTDDLRLTLSVANHQAQVRLDESATLRALPAPMRELCLVTIMRNLHGLACWWIDAPIALNRVSLPYPPPPHASAYDVLFPAPHHFDADTAALSFDAHHLGRALRRDEAALQRMLLRALPIVVWPYRGDRRLAERVRQALRDAPADGRNANALAAALHCSPRSLHRQLQAEGATLQALKDEAARETACALLLRSTRPIKQIAAECGFCNEKSFSRAFRGWTGLPPAAWRQAHEWAAAGTRPSESDAAAGRLVE